MTLERKEWERWLRSLPEPTDFEASLSGLKRWVNWVGRKRFTGADLSVEESFTIFLGVLRDHPDLAAKYREFLHALFVDVRYFKLFTNAGIPSEPLLIREFILRSFRLIFPPPIQPHRASDLFRVLFPRVEKAEFFREVTETQLREWIGYFPRDQFTRVDLVQGIQYLSLQIAGFGTRDDVWERSSLASRKAQYFHQLARTALAEDWAAMPPLLDALLQVLNEVESQMEEVGVSITLVFRIDRMRRQILRLKKILDWSSRESRSLKIFVDEGIELLQGLEQDANPIEVFRDQFRLLSKKIVESSGSAGDTAIVRTPTQYFALFKKAAGGGFLTSFTTFLKVAVTSLNFALFSEIFFSFLNYSGSFLLMQFFHYKLATKQPSLFAAALAAKIKETKNHYEFKEFLEEIQNIVRSQFISAVGNIVAVIPAVAVLAAVYFAVFQDVVLNEAKAYYGLSSMNPFTTGTVFYASLTGILLWIASVLGGAFENSCRYHHVEDSLSQNPLLRFAFGIEKAKRFSRAFVESSSGIASSVYLGLLLAVTPAMGKFFGLPIDVRHVTLSTGSATLSLMSLPFEKWDGVMIGMAALGIAITGILNFGVSFMLSLILSVRSKGVGGTWIRFMLKSAFGQIFINPRPYFFPPKKDPTAP